MLGFTIYILTIILIWLLIELDAALVRDRKWRRWVSAVFTLAALFFVGYIFKNSGPPGWGIGREIVGTVICVFLLQFGTAIHEDNTGKFLIRLPKKEINDD